MMVKFEVMFKNGEKLVFETSDDNHSDIINMIYDSEFRNGAFRLKSKNLVINLAEIVYIRLVNDEDLL